MRARRSKADVEHGRSGDDRRIVCVARRTSRTAVGVATSLAPAVLIVIATATKGAFCDMTAEMAKAAIQKV